MNKGVLIILSLLMAFFLSCKQKEKIVRREFGKKITEEELERRIFADNREIKTIRLEKINFSIGMDGEKFESGGTIAILKDSVIIVSLIPFMGYEVSRIFCYKDTILVLDRLEKIFFYTSLKRNMDKYNINGDFDDIESILTGRAFIYSDETEKNKLKKNIIKEDNNLKWNYEILENMLLRISQEITIREDILLAENIDISDRRNQIEISISYDQFKKVENFVFPYKIKIRVNSSQKKFDVELNIGNIVINDNINADVIIPLKYKEAIIDY
jgi:hypothetical protein